ncbi:MAG: EAL domain-containing protein [Treponema sp.]|nr:EAL domain-containing protein [Treponema sp.]
MAIFVVSHDEQDRQFFRAALQDSYELYEFADGEAALVEIRVDVLPEAFIVNMASPHASFLLEAAKKDTEMATIPFLAVVDATEQEAWLSALRAGANHELARPLEADFVHQAVDISIGQTKALYKSREIDLTTNVLRKEAFCRKTHEILSILAPEREYVIVRWDIARFSVLNDTFGIHVGDLVLEHIGQILQESAAMFVTYGRWESDNFVLCIEKERFDPAALNEFLVKALTEFFPAFKFSLHFGIYEVDDNLLDVNIMCDRAFLAQRTIKVRADRYYAYYTTAMRNQLLEEHELTTEMNAALETGQFRIYLQPQYDYAQNKIYGAEALVRWVHPQKGMIPPNRFIPLFERNGFISRLDEYIWEQACIFLRTMLNRGLPVVPLSINISRRDVDVPWLVRVLTSLIENYKLSSSHLRVEITESAYMDNPNELISMVDTLHAHGFHVEMDDFGSGYSSLNMLKDIYVDTLKLDMKFIDNAAHNARGGIILSYLVRMAHWLGMTVIAEGIETKEQADYLRSIGCLYMQGYYFGKPMSAAEFETLLIHNDNLLQTGMRQLSGLRGAANFFEASEQSALLFNRFVGGAAILEYAGGRLEVLRMNDAFFTELGITRRMYVRYQQQVLNAIVENDRHVLLDCLESAAQTGAEIHGEVRLNAFAGKSQGDVIHLRVILLAADSESRIFYCALENISTWGKRQPAKTARASTPENQTVHSKKRSAHLRAEQQSAVLFEYDVLTDTMQASYAIPGQGIVDKTYHQYLASFDLNMRVSQEYHDAYVVPFKGSNAAAGDGIVDFYGTITDGESGWYRLTYHTLTDSGQQLFRVEGSINGLDERHFELPPDVAERVRNTVDKGTAVSLIADALSDRPTGRLDALLLIAVDDFKLITKLHGTDGAERIVQSMIAACATVLRRGDLLVRLDASECLVYLRSIGSNGYALRTAAKLNECAMTVHVPEGTPIHCNIGGVYITDGEESFDTVFGKADSALVYIAQRGGNSFAFFNEDAMHVEDILEI